MLRFRGSQCFRQRLVCATISGRPIRIDDIRTDDQNPGLRDYEASLLRLIEKITNGCIIEINETGADGWGGREGGMEGQQWNAGTAAECPPVFGAGSGICTPPPSPSLLCSPYNTPVPYPLSGIHTVTCCPCLLSATRYQPAVQARVCGGRRPVPGARLRHLPSHRLVPGAAGADRAVGQEAADHYAAGCAQLCWLSKGILEALSLF